MPRHPDERGCCGAFKCPPGGALSTTSCLGGGTRANSHACEARKVAIVPGSTGWKGLGGVDKGRCRLGPGQVGRVEPQSPS